MFLIAGGPGQGSAQAFDLGSSRELATFQAVFPGYTLVAYDDRGTGNSGLLNCPGLQSAVTTVTEEAQLPVCAAAIGPNRQFYSTVDHANDLEQVRVALGLGQIGLFGTSYGTKLAMAYALAYPQNVSRILLNSVLPTSLPDPYESNVLRAMPATLNAFCGSSLCKAATLQLRRRRGCRSQRARREAGAGQGPAAERRLQDRARSAASTSSA